MHQSCAVLPVLQTFIYQRCPVVSILQTSKINSNHIHINYCFIEHVIVAGLYPVAIPALRRPECQFATQDACSARRTTDTSRRHVHSVPVAVENLQLCHFFIIPIRFLPTHEFGKPLPAVQKFRNLLSSCTSRSLHIHVNAGIRPKNIDVAYAIKRST